LKNDRTGNSFSRIPLRLALALYNEIIHDQPTSAVPLDSVTGHHSTNDATRAKMAFANMGLRIK